jgi:hypothetical protein
MTKYTLSKWSTKIEPHEVLRETASSVYVKWYRGEQRRQSKNTQYCQWFDSWDAAHSALVMRCEREVEQLRRRLEEAEGNLGNVRGMKPPQEVSA